MQVEKVSQIKHKPVFKKTATMTGQNDKTSKPKEKGTFVPLTTIEGTVAGFVNGTTNKNNKT